jgi:20S proteasome subunit beta 1
MGTSIMAVAFDGGVVMGADSRTTTGSYIANRVSDKITPITPRVYCCRSGSAADTQIISDYVRYYAAMHSVELGSEPLVGTAARLFRQICYQNKANLMAGIIVGGFDEQKGGQVYTIPLGGAMVRQPFSIGGSGSSYIYGFCDANFTEGMSREDCIDFVTKGLALASARDGSSGTFSPSSMLKRRAVLAALSLLPSTNFRSPLLLFCQNLLCFQVVLFVLSLSIRTARSASSSLARRSPHSGKDSRMPDVVKIVKGVSVVRFLTFADTRLGNVRYFFDRRQGESSRQRQTIALYVIHAHLRHRSCRFIVQDRNCRLLSPTKVRNPNGALVKF